jgi:hypothetical protein
MLLSRDLKLKAQNEGTANAKDLEFMASNGWFEIQDMR